MSEQITSVFISGNSDINDKKFIQYYLPVITELTKDENVYFNLSDDEGCAEMVQILLSKTVKDKSRVAIYCIGDQPKCYIDSEFVCYYGFRTLEERDAAMTMASNMDLHVILSGKGRSAVENNLCRRNNPEYDYMKYYLKGNTLFWQMFMAGVKEELENEVEPINLSDESEA
jgi:hypothetical protein